MAMEDSTVSTPRASKRIQTDYPAPIALSWRQVLRSYTKKEEHDRLLDTVEITAMTLAAILISQYRTNQESYPQVEEVLGKLQAASFGTWISAIETIQSELIKQIQRSIGNDIARLLARKDIFPAQRKAQSEIAKIIGQENIIIPSKFSILQFLNWAVTYRNEVAHAKPSPSEEVCRVRLSWFGPAVDEFLEALSFLADFPLVFLRQLRLQQGQVFGQAFSAIGWDLSRDQVEHPADMDASPGSLD
jgi:hypothetical protein